MRNEDLGWDRLILEDRPKPPVLTDEQFRQWIDDRQIFVSSRMDDEMATARQSVRSSLDGLGATPVMWEDVAPSDVPAERAYLEGVDRSSVFVLLLGSRYGTADRSGYSPIHKEWNRASRRSIPRLVFTCSDVQPSERAGRLNDWLGSIQSEVSTREYDDAEELVESLVARLRDLAAQQRSAWVKLGSIVFPGRVHQRAGEFGGTAYRVEGTVRDGSVRRAISGLGDRTGSRVRAERLSWPNDTSPVRVQEANVTTSVADEAEIEVVCETPRNHYGSQSGSVLGGMGSIGGAGPAEQAEIWAHRALFGENVERSGPGDMLYSVTSPEGPTLPKVLENYDAHGWVALGLARLYAIEGLLTRHGGHFERLDVGPVTATSLPLRIRFAPGSHGSNQETVEIEGNVPLPRKPS